MKNKTLAFCTLLLIECASLSTDEWITTYSDTFSVEADSADVWVTIKEVNPDDYPLGTTFYLICGKFHVISDTLK